MYPDDEDDRPTQFGKPTNREYTFDSGGDKETTLPQRPTSSRANSGGGAYENATVVRSTTPEIENVAWLYCKKGLRKGQLFQFKLQRTELGTASDCDFVVEDSFASKHHGAVLLSENKWLLHDFASTNGTTVNDQKLGTELSNPVELHENDVIAIGDTEFVFKEL